MFSKLTLCLSALLASIVLLCCISFVQGRLDKMVKENNLVDAGFIKEGAPPLVSFTTVALGSFRGLIADMLWLRASTLQDQGKYFEMVQLASWITKLQPRFTGATAYLAWNMAYNISVTFTSPEDRYRWISRGIELIRDEALTYNPSDPTLYKELGWIYQHKLGNVMDDANLYYKFQIAKEMMKVFGGADGDWPALAAAPVNEKAFRKTHPESDLVWAALKQAGIPSLKALSDSFRESGRLPDALINALSGKDFPKVFEAYMKASSSADYNESAFIKSVPEAELAIAALKQAGIKSLDELYNYHRGTHKLPEKLSNELSGSMRALDSYLRASWLRESYKLYPEAVLAIDNKYGKLDWRMPESYAIYWAYLGLEHSPKKESVDCDRMISQSLAVIFVAGRMLLPGGETTQANENFLIIPNLAVVDAARDAYVKGFQSSEGVQSFRSAEENFVKEAMVTLYTYGQYKKSKEYYEYLIKKFGEHYKEKGDFDQYVVSLWTEELRDAGYKQGNDIISSLILRSCIFIGYGDFQAAESHLRLAKFAHDYYQRSYKESIERMGLPSFEKMKLAITRNCLETFPPDMAKMLKMQIEEDAIKAGRNPEQALEAILGPKPAPAAPGFPGGSAQGPKTQTPSVFNRK